MPLTQAGLDSAAARLAVTPTEIWTVISVETSGCGFLADRRPQILFERHYFHQLTGGRFDDGDISDPTPGNYGSAGTHQYDRLTRAAALDHAAAIRSTSWGLGQIMGANAVSAGYPDAETMVAAMLDSEDAQLHAVAAFTEKAGLGNALKTHNWAKFAAGYNGPNYTKNQYDTKLAPAFATYLKSPLPDLNLRAAQLYLTYAGFQPGPIDGRMGKRTRDAIIAFQRQHQLPETGTADPQLLAALSAA